MSLLARNANSPARPDDAKNVAVSVGMAAAVVVGASAASFIIPFDFGLLDNAIVLGVLAKLFHTANFRRT